MSNLVQMLEVNSSSFPKRRALIFGSKKITYEHLASISKRLAGALYSLGLKRGDKVALWLPNCPEFVYSFFATLQLGAIVVPINTMFKREEARYIVQNSGAKIMICSIEKSNDCENILSRLTTLEHVICLPLPQGETPFLDFHRLVNTSEAAPPHVPIGEDTLAEIVYTSGTTGVPKGACLSHKNLLSNVSDCATIINMTEKDCVLCILPLFHSFSSTVCMLMPLYKGASLVIMRAVRPFKRVIRAVFKHKVTVFPAVPSIYNILAEAKFPRFGLLMSIFINPVRLFISGAAALPYQVWKKFEQRFHRPLLQGYGLTEASPVVSLNPFRGKRKPESVGVPLPSVQVKVVDSQEKELPRGEVGELLVAGPNVMERYYHLDDETRAILKGGWLFTGDLAKVDSEGYIFIMGRLKEMINVRGFNVYPQEIEDVLYRHPRIKEAAVVGVMHRHRGEVPVAFIVKKGGLYERELIQYLRANLAPYKIPLKIFSRDSLPKNPAGKIIKRQLQEDITHIFGNKKPVS